MIDCLENLFLLFSQLLNVLLILLKNEMNFCHINVKDFSDLIHEAKHFEEVCELNFDC